MLTNAPLRPERRARLAWLATAAASMICLAPLAAFAGEAPARQVIALQDGWRFHLGDVAGADAPGFSDSDWQSVAVPHTWNRAGYYTSDAHQRINTAETINKTQGVGWYRTTFAAPPTLAGKRLWLQFDAASRTAEVWLNGVKLGAHNGGFSRFRFDATSAVKLGAANVLVVKADNTKPAPGAPTADSLPLAGDFFVHGGLYRPVTLITTAPVHFDMLDYGGPGVYADTTSIGDGGATVRVRSNLRFDPVGAKPGQSLKPEAVSLRARLIDAQGVAVAETTSAVTITPGQAVQSEQTLRLATARLWQGVEDPYLYRLVVEVLDAKGVALDQVDQAFGVRQIRIDPEKGFFLNGRHVQLHGVGYHQDQEGKGWAKSEADIANDIAILREMGANTIRLTHYQHGQPIHDLADRYGLILWDEIALVTTWTPPGKNDPTPGLVANAELQLKELIRQNYNHASVATWGVANEVDMGNSLPAFITGAGPEADPLPLLNRLSSLSKAEDPSRPVTQAACCEGRLYDASVKVPNVAPATDLLGVNRYFGWYYGKVDELEADLDGMRAKRPAQPLSVSEYGAGGAISIHTDDPAGGPADSRGREQPEEYLSQVHEATWAILSRKPYLWATWLWNSFDFATTIRREGDAQDINTKGLVTYDRQIRKDAFYFYKANWTTTPTVHITGRRYADRAYNVTDVKVYSNAPSTELLLNGKSLGVREACPQGICVWKGVALTGSNAVVAKGRFASGEVGDTLSWTVAPEVLKAVRIDSGVQVAPVSTPRFGSDAFFDGGAAATVNTPADYGKAPEYKTIEGAANSRIAATYREGAFSYRIPVAPGRYRVTLTFVEPKLAPGERVFSVLSQGKPVVANIDVAAAAGGPMKAVTKTFLLKAKDGVVDLRFAPTKGQAIVSAVEVEAL